MSTVSQRLRARLESPGFDTGVKSAAQKRIGGGGGVGTIHPLMPLRRSRLLCPPLFSCDVYGLASHFFPMRQVVTPPPRNIVHCDLFGVGANTCCCQAAQLLMENRMV